MLTFIKIILIFALIIAILMGATLFRIYRNVRDTLHSFGFNSTKKRRTTYRPNTTREETIHTHNAKQMKKKIIPKDEGEYVDFTEVR